MAAAGCSTTETRRVPPSLAGRAGRPAPDVETPTTPHPAHQVSTSLAGARCSTTVDGRRWLLDHRRLPRPAMLAGRAGRPGARRRDPHHAAPSSPGLDVARWRSLLDHRWAVARLLDRRLPRPAFAGRAGRPAPDVETSSTDADPELTGLDVARWRSLLDHRWRICARCSTTEDAAFAVARWSSKAPWRLTSRPAPRRKSGLDVARWRSLLDHRGWPPLAARPPSCRRGCSTPKTAASGHARWSSRAPRARRRDPHHAAPSPPGLDVARRRSLLDHRGWPPLAARPPWMAAARCSTTAVSPLWHDDARCGT